MSDVKKTYVLGTAIKITAMLTVDTPTAITIDIEDPSEILKVDTVAMTKEADGVYSYIYQSDKEDLDGVYIVTISALYGGYTAVVQDKFTLVEQD
jgi:hypothetical protein